MVSLLGLVVLDGSVCVLFSHARFWRFLVCQCGPFPEFVLAAWCILSSTPGVVVMTAVEDVEFDVNPIPHVVEVGSISRER